jgi:hypothetical protein
MRSETTSEAEAGKGAEATQGERGRELHRLLVGLKRELAELSKTHEEEAQSIAGFADLAAHEACRKEQDPRLLKLALEGLKTSIEQFEASHPRLVQIVGAIANTLASLGL